MLIRLAATALAVLTSLPSLGIARAGGTTEAMVAKIDAMTADPDQKMVVLEAMAVRLETHRNHLLLLRRQTGESFGQIFVRQLEKRGKTPDEIASELRALYRELGQRLQLAGEPLRNGAPPPRPVLYLGTGIDHNSTGTFYSLVPEAGIETRRFTLVGGVPYYWNSGTDASSSGVGDAYVSALTRGTAAGLEVGANLVIGFPTGDETLGLGAGKVTVDGSGLLQKRFERFRPFVKAGLANYIFNNVGYQRPYFSTGNAAHVSGGIDFRLHRRLVAGAGGFLVRPWGNQRVHSRMPDNGVTGRLGDMPAGMGGGTAGMGGGNAGSVSHGGQFGGAGMNAPFLHAGHQGIVPAEDLRDHGAVGWASVELRPGVTLNLSVARSVPFALTTFGFGVGVDFARLFFPGKSF